ncbi:chromosome segregation protein SMC [Mycetocola reblochoni]|uniref:Chromosome partition protein Smc n=2 Tax=Mycetocola reblochoni TaxID=331618 RepID=A0A1R4JB72_9MICO|nr:AAA family ATPase [Mycetocola reblochoni]RLP70002.1 chromosome segregation protein SMC [Mycetocola reblochoni]SJN29391.1 Chromosome partition protein smc [Mycetocola reblochoni REB411]
MYLKSMTLRGFKSFAQKTTFAFEPGVTCVVGPNGSGKSNVVDALAWVMGEQGAKTLRGGKMEDVIFAGTSTRGPLGRAEVSVTIDNTDGALPIDYSEVTISRTLFRNGGSEYAINGRSVRLLDVQELLSDSGLGREMHVIVGQGQLDSVLRASAEERRGFIEEAAGILKHRRRKERTVRKLDAMQANLTRLNDLAGELRRQLKPLGKQAEVAREAQGIQAVLRDARARLLADEVVGLRRQLGEHDRSEQERHTERIVLQEKLEQNQIRSARIEQDQSSDAVDGARAVLFALESVHQRLRNLHTLTQQRLALLDAQEESAQVTRTVTEQAVTEAREEVAALREAIGGAERAVEQARAATAGRREALDAIDREIQAQAELVSAHDLELSTLQGAADAAASRLAAVRGEAQRQSAAAADAEQRESAAIAEQEQLRASAPTAPEEGDDVSARYTAAQAEVIDREAALDAARTALHEAQSARDSHAARAAALGRALEVSAGGSELDLDGVPGVVGLVADSVHPRAGSEAVVARALGSLAEAVLVDDFAAASRVLALAAEADTSVDVVVAGAGRPEVSGGVPAMTRVSELATAPDGVLAVLDLFLLAEDLDGAVAALALAPVAMGAVTAAGEVVTASTLSGGGSRERGRIQLTAERDAAVAERDAAATAAVGRDEELVAARVALRAAQERSTSALAALREQDGLLAEYNERVNGLRVRVDAARAERERAGAAQLAASAALRDAEALAASTSAAVDVARSKPRPIVDAHARDEAAAELERARDEEIEARFVVETAKERVRQAEGRAASLRRRREAEGQAAEAAARKAVVRRRQREAAERVAASLPELIASAERSVAEARVRLVRAEDERREQNAELAELRRDGAQLRDRLQLITEDVHSLELQIYEKKLQLSSLLERAASELGLVEQVLVAEYGPDRLVPRDGEDVAEMARRAVARSRARSAAASADADVPVPSPDADVTVAGGAEAEATEATVTAASTEAAAVPADPAECTPDGDGPDGDVPDGDGPLTPEDGVPFVRAEQQRRLARAEQMLSRLGRINPLALEEFAALEQRHLFLTEQLADLAKTRSDLETIITELDERMQLIFREAFEDTREAFNEVFPVLFPGGTGTLALSDPDNLLTTGIEVSVRPAGKKVERLSLLSGGERSLAAVALLVAIFKARPSPFYIMDEVEAALDDANLGRLLQIFEDLRASSQLIVITHQKRTMEIADALYGVSMRQDGVSAVVGQRIRTDGEESEAG